MCLKMAGEERKMIRVLVADDEPIERMVVMKKIRKQFGTEVELIEAENGREVVEQFQKNPFQIAVLDVEMPGTNGLEAAAAIRALNGECEIIILTAFDEFQYAKKAITVRALDYLLKPVSDEELFMCLDEAVQRVSFRLNNETLYTEVRNKMDDTSQDMLSDERMEDETDRSIKNQVISKKILQYIDEHYREDISLQELAEFLNYSEAYFSTVFKQCFDQNFTVFLSKYRVEKARKLLEDITINVKEISEEVGYRDSNYFSKVFKRITGVTPSEYRKSFMQYGVVSPDKGF